MQPLLRSSLFLLLSGLFTRAAAGNFAAQIPADSFMYLEARNVPEYRQRLAEIPAIQKMGDVDWQKLILQLYRIGLENDDGVGIDAEDLSVGIGRNINQYEHTLAGTACASERGHRLLGWKL